MSRDAETNLETLLHTEEGSGPDNLRLFVGITVDDRICEKLAGARKQLEGRLGRIRWVPLQNLHLTVKFLGSVERERVLEVADGLNEALSAREQMSLSVEGLGVFPSVHKARILWAGLRGEGLETLVECVETRLAALGFAREHRRFKPHLTLGRWRVPEKNPLHITEALVQWRDHRFGSFSLTDVKLFQSVLEPAGAVYTVLQSFELGQSRLTRDTQE